MNSKKNIEKEEIIPRNACDWGGESGTSEECLTRVSRGLQKKPGREQRGVAGW